MFKRLDTQAVKERLREDTPATPATLATRRDESCESSESSNGIPQKLHFPEDGNGDLVEWLHQNIQTGGDHARLFPQMANYLRRTLTREQFERLRHALVQGDFARRNADVSRSPPAVAKPDSAQESRSYWGSRALAVHAEIERTLSPEQAHRLAETPGWLNTLNDLEDAFRAKYEAGLDCGMELDMIKAHWLDFTPCGKGKEAVR